MVVITTFTGTPLFSRYKVCMLTVKRTVDQNIKTEHREPNNEIEKKMNKTECDDV